MLGAVSDANARMFPFNDAFWMLYKTHPWVRAVNQMIAEAVANEGYSIAKAGGKEQADLDTDPRVEAIHTFFDEVPVGNTWRELMMATAIDMGVFGRAFWRLKIQGILLLGIERLDPRLVVPKFSDDRKSILSYALKRDGCQIGGQSFSDAGTPETIDAKEVVMFRYPGGDVLLGAGSKLESLNWTLAMDMNVRRHRNSYFANGAPAGTVLINKSANDVQVRAAVKQVKERAGSQHAYLPIILTGDWEAVNTLQSGKQEVDFVKGTGISREEVCAVYAMPPGKLVYSDNSLGSSGKSEDDNTFQMDCVLPLEELLYETITIKILRRFFTDMADLCIVPRRRNRLRLDRVDAAMKMVKAGATGNDARDVMNLPKVTDEKYGMDVPLFIGATGQNGVASDEATDGSNQQEPTTGVDPAIEQSTTANKQSDANEVGKKAKPRFPPWY